MKKIKISRPELCTMFIKIAYFKVERDYNKRYDPDLDRLLEYLRKKLGYSKKELKNTLETLNKEYICWEVENKT